MSLLTSIFGTSSDGGGGDTSTTANEKEKQTTSDLFANSISVPPALPPPRDSAAAASSNKRKVSFATASDETASNQDNNNNNNTTDEDERTVFVGNLPIQTTRKDLLKLFASCGPIQSTRIRNVPIVSPETGNTNNSNHKPIKIAQAGRPGIVQKIKVNTADESMLDTRYQASVQGYVVFASTDSIPNALQLHNTPFTLTMNRRLNKKKKNANDDDDMKTRRRRRILVLVPPPQPTTSTITRHIRVDRVSGQKEYDAKRSVFIGNLPYHADEEMLRIALLQHSKGIVVDDNDKVDNDNKESDDSQQQQPNDSSDPSSSSSSSSPSSVIQGIRIIRDATTHQCKGFGYVLLQNKSQVSYALQHWNNIMYENRPLRVRVLWDTIQIIESQQQQQQ
jgi:RNA recognition motif-containing protein